MLKNILVIALCCVSYLLAEAPLNRYRAQRFRQPQQQQFLARQQAPYSDRQSVEPNAVYGAPPNPTTIPGPKYGAPPQRDVDLNGEPVAEAEAEAEAEAFAGPEPSRLTSQKLSLPSPGNPPKFGQRLELQQQVQLPARQVISPPLEYTHAHIQQAGSYYVQLPNGNIQRVTYLAQPDHVDNSVFAQLQFRPVAQAQAVVTEPEVYVNTVVQAYTASE